MADNFEKIFNTLTGQYDPNKIFDEFLEYSIDINLMSLKDRGLDFQGREKSYFELFQEWIMITNNELENHPWYDYLGTFYENVIQTKFKAGTTGQFFTPPDVCKLMIELTINENIDYTNKMVNDCACGSGRFLLAGQEYLPNSIMIGADLDEMACKMTVLNFYIHGVRGSVLHMNTITGEFFGGYKVNQYFGYGLPLPHIERLNSYEDAFHFFGDGLKDSIGEHDVVEVNPLKSTMQVSLDSFLEG